MRHYFGTGISGGKGLKVEDNEQVDLFVAHPLPWNVKYNKEYKTWHEKSRPTVVDANDALVFQPLQYVGHPGVYDMLANQVCHFMVESANKSLIVQ